MNSPVVLDASALLAYLRDEVGWVATAEAMAEGAAISAANYAEVLSKAAEEGEDPDRLAERLEAEGVIGGGVEVFPVTEADARVIARLRPLTRPAGLSLGDRACIALGLRLGCAVLTTDRQWTSKSRLRRTASPRAYPS